MVMFLDVLYVITILLGDIVLFGVNIVIFLKAYEIYSGLNDYESESTSFEDSYDKENKNDEEEKVLYEDDTVFTTAELEEVERFRERIAALKRDRDGLYDVVDEPITNFTGAEISDWEVFYENKNRE